MEVNEEKRQKFMEYAGKRVNNVLHGIQILEPMARSSSYDFTKQDVEEMFSAMQDSLNSAKEEFYRKFEEKGKAEKKMFSFGMGTSNTNVVASVSAESNIASQAIENSSIIESPVEEVTDIVEE